LAETEKKLEVEVSAKKGDTRAIEEVKRELKSLTDDAKQATEQIKDLQSATAAVYSTRQPLSREDAANVTQVFGKEQPPKEFRNPKKRVELPSGRRPTGAPTIARTTQFIPGSLGMKLGIPETNIRTDLQPGESVLTEEELLAQLKEAKFEEAEEDAVEEEKRVAKEAEADAARIKSGIAAAATGAVPSGEEEEDEEDKGFTLIEATERTLRPSSRKSKAVQQQLIASLNMMMKSKGKRELVDSMITALPTLIQSIIEDTEKEQNLVEAIQGEVLTKKGPVKIPPREALMPKAMLSKTDLQKYYKDSMKKSFDAYNELREGPAPRMWMAATREVIPPEEQIPELMKQMEQLTKETIPEEARKGITERLMAAIPPTLRSEDIWETAEGKRHGEQRWTAGGLGAKETFDLINSAFEGAYVESMAEVSKVPPGAGPAAFEMEPAQMMEEFTAPRRGGVFARILAGIPRRRQRVSEGGTNIEEPNPVPMDWITGYKKEGGKEVPIMGLNREILAANAMRSEATEAQGGVGGPAGEGAAGSAGGAMGRGLFFLAYRMMQLNRIIWNIATSTLKTLIDTMAQWEETISSAAEAIGLQQAGYGGGTTPARTAENLQVLTDFPKEALNVQAALGNITLAMMAIAIQAGPGLVIIINAIAEALRGPIGAFLVSLINTLALFAPIILNVLKALTPLMPTLGFLAGIFVLFAPIISIISGLIMQILGLGPLIGAIVGFITTTLIPVIAAVVAAIGWPVIAIGLLIAAIVLLVTNFGEIRDALTGFVQGIIDWIKNSWIGQAFGWTTPANPTPVPTPAPTDNTGMAYRTPQVNQTQYMNFEIGNISGDVDLQKIADAASKGSSIVTFTKTMGGKWI